MRNRIVMRYSRGLAAALLLWPLLSFAAAATQNRVVRFGSHDESDRKKKVEVLEIQAAGMPITLGKPFYADGDWLKTLKVRVRYVGEKPVVYLAVGFGLLEGVNQRLEPQQSWPYGFQLGHGAMRRPNAEDSEAVGAPPPKPQRDVPAEKPQEVVLLNPNEEVELTFDSVDAFIRGVIEKPGVGKLSQAVMKDAIVQYEDGTFEEFDLVVKVANEEDGRTGGAKGAGGGPQARR